MNFVALLCVISFFFDRMDRVVVVEKNLWVSFAVVGFVCFLLFCGVFFFFFVVCLRVDGVCCCGTVCVVAGVWGCLFCRGCLRLGSCFLGVVCVGCFYMGVLLGSQ